MVALDEVLLADAERRKRLNETEELKREKNLLDAEVGRRKRNGEEFQELLPQLGSMARRIKQLGAEQARAEENYRRAWDRLPNLPHPDAPDQDTEVRRVGADNLLLSGLRHDHLAENWIETEQAAKLSGSRFVYLKGPLVRVQMALVSFALDTAEKHGHTGVVPPVLVRERGLHGTGFLPDNEQQIYALPDDDLYLVGTSEVALASLHADEIMDTLPVRYAGISPCCRREAGAAGRDSRGLIRLHQFDKVELFSFVSPEKSEVEHQRILAIEEEILQGLEIPYRVMSIAANDLGSSAGLKFDCEGWFPGQSSYRELTSCSNTMDFQARRLNIQFRRGGIRQPVHTLNGTAVAVGRTMACLLENHQQPDGSIQLPEVLLPYGAPAVLRP